MRHSMISYSTYKCWEIMNCKNPDCLARFEPEIPCWEIARKVEAYHDLSNTCCDCLVYKLKNEALRVNLKKFRNIRRWHSRNFAAGHQGCIKSLQY